MITGKGHVLGTFPLGSRQLGTDYFIVWPWASLSIVDPSTDYSEESLEAVRELDPWLAAGRGLIDDVLSPEDSIESIRWLIDVYMSNRTGTRQEVSSAVMTSLCTRDTLTAVGEIGADRLAGIFCGFVPV